MLAKATTYSEVAHQLIRHMKEAGTLPSLHKRPSDDSDAEESEPHDRLAPEQLTSQEKSEKNIKRHVYDALNV